MEHNEDPEDHCCPPTILQIVATGIALSALLIAAYSRPFTGELSVGPDLLKQVIASEAGVGISR
jgi:hypothetical protein